jgi:signal transduction histidine kinase
LIRSLRRKFIAMTMAVFTALLCVIFDLVIHFTGQNLQAESVRFLRSAAADPLQPGPPGQVRQPCFIIRATPWGQSIQSTGGFDLSDEQMLSDIVALAASAPEPLGVLDQYDLRYFRSQSPAELTLVFMDISAERAAMRNLRLTCLGIGLLALGLFWAVSFLLARWAVRPVERAWEEQRQFVSDASHELKTPLTVILTSAELMQTDPDPQHIRSILAMSRRMRELVESLLELARVDNGAVRAAFEELDLTALVADELLPFEPLFFEGGLTLESQLEEGLRISGSDRHLRQVLTILLDNALRYSPENATVRVALTRQGTNALLTVTNPGFLTKEQCRSIFRRFYRADPARTAGGSGLGLAIAQGIALDHGGKLWADSREGDVTLSLTLPLK